MIARACKMPNTVALEGETLLDLWPGMQEDETLPTLSGETPS